MSMPAALRDRLKEQVVVTVLGTPTYNSRGDKRAVGTATTYLARVERGGRMLNGPDGRSVQAVGRAFIGPSTAGVDPSVFFDPRNQLTVDGVVYKMLNVETLTGTDGTVHHVVVHFG